MDVAMMQPAFMPWQGYFALMEAADLFVFLDDFQFCSRSWHQRNRLLVAPDKADWYTVPVSKLNGSRQPLNLMPLADTEWREALWRKLEMNYSRHPFFDTISPMVREWLLQSHDSLAAFDMQFIRSAAKLMGLDCKFVQSSEIGVDGRRSDAILNMLRRLEANKYLSARGSFEYMLEDGVFPDESVETVFLDFEPVVHPQLGTTGFIAYLSVLDALMNLGPADTLAAVRDGVRGWTDWGTMAMEAEAGVQR